MKLTGIGVSVAAVEVAEFLEEAVVFGAAFAAAGFEVIRAIWYMIVANELQQDARQRVSTRVVTPRQHRQHGPGAPQAAWRTGEA